jgi:hypothetical protein
MRMSLARETSVVPTATYEPVTGRTPNAWAARREDQAQSATFRALAWSEDDDSVAEPLPYTGEEYLECSDSRPGVRVTADTAEPPSATGYRRPTLLYGIAAGFAAAAIGGLLLTVVNTDDGPTTISTKVTQPAANVVNSQPDSEKARQDGPIRQFVPAPVKTAGVPVRAVPSAVAPGPTIAGPAPETQTPSTPEAAVPEVAVPEAAVPEVAVPEAVAPEAAAPEFTAPDAKPPVLVPPVISSPVVSLPEVTPQQVPNPVGPLDFDLPTDFHVPTVADPPIAWPAAPAAPNPVLNWQPEVVIPVVIPTISTGAGQ